MRSMQETLRRVAFIAERAFAYRLHVYVVTFLLVLVVFPGQMLELPAYLIALCFAMLMAFIYLVNKVTDKNEDSVNVRAGSIPDSSRRLVLLIAWAFAAAPFLYIVRVGDGTLIAAYIVVWILGYLYSFPIKAFGKKFRFKQVLFLKTTTSSVIWALPPAAAYAFANNASFEMTLSKFFVVFCIGATMEIIWDVRDMQGDKQFDIHTIANTFGVPIVRFLGIALLFLAGVFANASGLYIYNYIGLVLSGVFVLLVNKDSPAWFYHATAFVWIPLLLVMILTR